MGTRSTDPNREAPIFDIVRIAPRAPGPAGRSAPRPAARPAALVTALLTAFLVVPSATGALAAQGTSTDASRLVRAGLEAMGGADRWRDLGSIHLVHLGHRHALEQSERPEGPWVTTYTEVEELRDLSGHRLRRIRRERGFWSLEWREVELVGDTDKAVTRMGERTRITSSDGVAESLELSPERILLTALDAPDLRVGRDTVIQAVRHRAVEFSFGERPVRLFLNVDTRLPAGYAMQDAESSLFRQIWGELPTVTLWSLWSLEPGGWLYPRQQDRYRLEHPLDRTTLLAVEFSPPVPADAFALLEQAEDPAASGTGPAPTTASFRPGQTMPGQPGETTEAAPGVISIPGVYYTTLVEQPDGVVVLDGPMTSSWAVAVLEEARRRFPDKPVKAVISTSDAWLHIGGLRTFAERGVPIIALDLNVPLLRRFLATAPVPIPSDGIRAVSTPIEVGIGPNRLGLYPIRGEGGERMMAVYLPGHRVLYASDLVQRQGPDFFWPSYLMEVAAVVERHGLDPERVMALHLSPTPWDEVTGALDRLAAPTPGDGGG